MTTSEESMGFIALLPVIIGPLLMALCLTLFIRRARGKAGALEENRIALDQTALRKPSALVWIAAGAFALLYAVGAIVAPSGFLQLQRFLNLFRNNSMLICLACGMTCVMITGGIDLSAGAVAGLACMILADGITNKEADPTQMVLFVLLIGLLFGLAQGFLIGYLGIPSAFVSLGGLLLAYGVTTMISYEYINVRTENWLTDLGKFRIPMPFELGAYENSKGARVVPYMDAVMLIALGVVVLTALLLRFTRTGRSLYAVGGSPQGAAAAGVNVKRATMTAYALCGLLCSIGGILYFMQNRMASPVVGTGMEIRAISAAVIGGALFIGGAGSALGALLGALALGALQTLFAVLGVDSALQTLGTVLLLFLFLMVQMAFIRRNAGKTAPDGQAPVPEAGESAPGEEDPGNQRAQA